MLDIKCSSGSGERRSGGEDRGGMKGEEAIVGILYERRIKKKKERSSAADTVLVNFVFLW